MHPQQHSAALFFLLTVSLVSSATVADENTAKDSKAKATTTAGRTTAEVVEFPLAWPGEGSPSTHELAYNPRGGREFWVTGQTHDHIARVSLDGTAEFFAMPPGSRPHGIQFDASGQLWVSLEFHGLVARIDSSGKIVQQIDIRMNVAGAKQPINPFPHGLGLDADGRTLCFTGKKTSTIGRINPDGSVEHFELPTIGAVPIYLATGWDGNIWCTELVGNRIARITPQGQVTEFDIPTPNSRPIAVVAGPDGRSMWFSEEAGNKVGRIDADDCLTEFAIPMTQKNAILAGMAFDSEGHLWTHSYVNRNSPLPAGADYIIRVDRSIQQAEDGDLSGIPVTYFRVPSAGTVMHRILAGPDGNIWFTELGLDKLGRLTMHPQKQ
ncbi:MAG: hypothetical protein KDA79_18630 [Planctomycetaceae bacterium]|nr:hypothetical protein [Planctomycetaceae bacterium]